SCSAPARRRSSSGTPTPTVLATAPAPAAPHPVRSWAAPAAVGAGAGAYLAVARLTDPFAETTVAGVTVQCPVHGVTGGFCPGCGSTRAVHELLHGDVAGSL